MSLTIYDGCAVAALPTDGGETLMNSGGHDKKYSSPKLCPSNTIM